jgi:hypothetical protein
MQVWWRVLDPKNIRYRKQERERWLELDFNSSIYVDGRKISMRISKPLEG